MNGLYGEFKDKKIAKGKKFVQKKTQMTVKEKQDIRDDLSDFWAADEEFEDVLNWGILNDLDLLILIFVIDEYYKIDYYD